MVFDATRGARVRSTMSDMSWSRCTLGVPSLAGSAMERLTVLEVGTKGTITAPSLHHHRTITAPSLHHHCTITAPSLRHHCAITAPSLHHHCTITLRTPGVRTTSTLHTCTITAPSLHRHCTITAPHCTITAPSLLHHCTSLASPEMDVNRTANGVLQ